MMNMGFRFEMCSTENRVYLAQVDPVTKTVLWTRPDCHLWMCEDCAEINKRRWTAIVAEGIKLYQAQGITDWRFVTITSNGKLATFNQTLWVWRKAWPTLYARMKRAFPTMRYVYLPERHKNGRLHMHGIMSSGMQTRWLKDNAPYCGLGYKSESAEIMDISLACFYVLKYVTKSLQNGIEWPKSLHRVRTSQKWPKLKLEPFVKDLDGIWKTTSAIDWPEKSARLIHEGYVLTNIKTGEVEGVTF